MPFYTKHLEEGTGAHFIPRTPKLMRWAAKRGIPFIALKKSIAKKGTQPHPFVKSVINRELLRLKETVENEVNKTIRRKDHRNCKTRSSRIINEIGKHTRFR